MALSTGSKTRSSECLLPGEDRGHVGPDRSHQQEQNDQDDHDLQNVETHAATSELFWLEQRVAEIHEGQEHDQPQKVNAHTEYSSRPRKYRPGVRETSTCKAPGH